MTDHPAPALRTGNKKETSANTLPTPAIPPKSPLLQAIKPRGANILFRNDNPAIDAKSNFYMDRDRGGDQLLTASRTMHIYFADSEDPAPAHAVRPRRSRRVPPNWSDRSASMTAPSRSLHRRPGGNWPACCHQARS